MRQEASRGISPHSPVCPDPPPPHRQHGVSTLLGASLQACGGFLASRPLSQGAFAYFLGQSQARCFMQMSSHILTGTAFPAFFFFLVCANSSSITKLRELLHILNCIS